MSMAYRNLLEQIVVFFKSLWFTLTSKKRTRIERIRYENMESMIDRLHNEMDSAESFIEAKRNQFIQELSKNVYEFNPAYDNQYINKDPCKCTFYLEVTADELNHSFFNDGAIHLYAQIELVPYTVCYPCKMKLKKGSTPIRTVLRSLKEGRLQIHLADTIKFKMERKGENNDEE